MNTLYYQTHSPYARKVLVLMHELKMAEDVEVIHQETSPLVENQKVFEKNPLGKVPVLIHEGTTLFDSKVIVQYVLGIAQHKEWPHDLASQQLEALADSLMDIGILCRWEMERRPQQYRYHAFYEGQMKKIQGSLDWLEQNINAQSELTVGGLACACAVDWLVFRQLITLQARPNLLAWFSHIVQRESMQKTQYEGYTDDGFVVDGLLDSARLRQW